MTAVEFNETGEFLAIGDKAGRVSIVQEAFQAQPNMVRRCLVCYLRHWLLMDGCLLCVQPLEYKFFTEFQSHDPEFDCLKRCDPPSLSAVLSRAHRCLRVFEQH